MPPDFERSEQILGENLIEICQMGGKSSCKIAISELKFFEFLKTVCNHYQDNMKYKIQTKLALHLNSLNEVVSPKKKKKNLNKIG